MTVVGILEHLPTEATLVQTEKNRERQQRYRERERAHAAGDDSLRVPEGGGKCEAVNGCAQDVTRDVTATVTRDVGTGRAGTGKFPSP